MDVDTRKERDPVTKWAVLLFYMLFSRLHRWSLRMDRLFHPTLYLAYDKLSMLGIKIIHVSKRGPAVSLRSRAIDIDLFTWINRGAGLAKRVSTLTIVSIASNWSVLWRHWSSKLWWLTSYVLLNEIWIIVCIVWFKQTLKIPAATVNHVLIIAACLQLLHQYRYDFNTRVIHISLSHYIYKYIYVCIVFEHLFKYKLFYTVIYESCHIIRYDMIWNGRAFYETW